MNESVVPMAPSTGNEASPAFVQAVADLSAKRPVTTSQPIYNQQGIKLLEGGVAIGQSLYEKLVSHRLSLPLDECIDPGPGVDAASLESAARAAVVRWPFFARVAPEGASGQALFDAVAATKLPKPVALHLTLARETRPALFDHSVLMALLSAHLVRESGAAPAEVRDAAAAGLLHDLGMLHIESGLLDSEERLSGDELRPVYVHPLTSSMLVDRFAVYSKDIVRAIVEHHERLDGSGYPRGLSGDAMSPLGRVLALAEVVTAMFDGARRLPEQRVSLLLRINPRRYDPAHVAVVHRLLDVAAPAGDARGHRRRSAGREAAAADRRARALARVERSDPPRPRRRSRRAGRFRRRAERDAAANALRRRRHARAAGSARRRHRRRRCAADRAVGARRRAALAAPCGRQPAQAALARRRRRRRATRPRSRRGSPRSPRSTSHETRASSGTRLGARSSERPVSRVDPRATLASGRAIIMRRWM